MLTLYHVAVATCIEIIGGTYMTLKKSKILALIILIPFTLLTFLAVKDYGFTGIFKEIGLSTLFRTIFIRSFFYILQVFYNLVIHEYECYCTNSHNQINLFLALQNF